MSDTFWILVTIALVVWLFIGIFVAAYHTANHYAAERDWIKIQLGWPIYLVQLPALIRERKQNEHARLARLRQKTGIQ